LTILKNRDPYGSCTLHPGQVLSVSHSSRQVPLRLLTRQRTCAGIGFETIHDKCVEIRLMAIY